MICTLKYLGKHALTPVVHFETHRKWRRTDRWRADRQTGGHVCQGRWRTITVRSGSWLHGRSPQNSWPHCTFDIFHNKMLQKIWNLSPSTPLYPVPCFILLGRLLNFLIALFIVWLFSPECEIYEGRNLFSALFAPGLELCLTHTSIQ